MKIEIKKDKTEFNKFKVTMELTEGQILAIQNALEKYMEISTPAKDVYACLSIAKGKSGIW